MGAIEDMAEVVVVVVHLRRRQLSLINDVLGRERAYIEALRKGASHTDARIGEKQTQRVELTCTNVGESEGTNIVCVACFLRM